MKKSINKMECNDIHLISLGFNCEVSFRIEDYFNGLESYLYSWSYELDRNLFLKSLQAMKDVFEHEISLTEEHMFKCEKYQMKFHPRYDILSQSGSFTEESYVTALEELKSRLSHLKEKTETTLADSSKKIFFAKIQKCGEESDYNYIESLNSILKEINKESAYLLICVMEKGSVTDKLLGLESDCLKIRIVRKFAPVKHTDILGDIQGWGRIFLEATGYKSKYYYRNIWHRRIKVVIPMIRHKLRKMRNNLK